MDNYPDGRTEEESRPSRWAKSIIEDKENTEKRRHVNGRQDEAQGSIRQSNPGRNQAHGLLISTHTHGSDFEIAIEGMETSDGALGGEICFIP